ncbi:sulfite exporter TauE/SafE family protein [Sphingomonas colocasiae]|uniref:sulfite exporter TauE/SafE family protein n=1 Tax=Sphingomonas colocasiae TaxID=1848973 RepID=UPI001FECD49A|nr:sulfite exporter TauE/SafE family protein [Sphingomonas colocasiae]
MADPAAGAVLALAAGLAGGAMNALAGGGTFATMPTLIALGLPSPIANATSNVALQPGAITSAWAYRDGLAPLGGIQVRTLVAITFFGGLVGSLLLVATPTRTFDIVIPWLLLLATLVMAFGKRASNALHSRVTIGPGTMVAVQLALGIYGGYFGGGVGLMMMAAWGLLAGAEPHHLAAPRTLMLAVANAAATIIFIGATMVAWQFAVPMLIGSIAGGYLGARVGRILAPHVIRVVTLLVTATMTVIFFLRAYS